MITAFHVKNFKALRDISLQLTPIHVLIGPNDSGKTSILSALAALSRSVDFELGESFGGRWEGRELVWQGDSDGTIELRAEITDSKDSLIYSLECNFPNAGRSVRTGLEAIHLKEKIDCVENIGKPQTRVCTLNSNGNSKLGFSGEAESCKAVHDALSGVQYFRWNPRMLALPVAPDSKRSFRMNSDGFGLALLLDDILSWDRKKFDELETRFTAFFPKIASIKLIRQKAFRAALDDVEQFSKLEQAEGKGLAFALKDSKQIVPASQVSDGAMLILGYLAVLYSPKPPRLLLVEEPENGIHPKLLKDVLSILREILGDNASTQIVLTTHSPYAVDLFAPEEVTLCTKNPDGSIAVTRMADSPTVRDQLSLFSLGEIWTAEGDEDLAKSGDASSQASAP